MTDPPGRPAEHLDVLLGRPATELLQRLKVIRAAIVDARAGSTTPAVARALALTEIQLFLAMTYLGYTEQLFPEEDT